jgi:hypothetical protein
VVDVLLTRVLAPLRDWVERVVFYELINAPDYALAYHQYSPGMVTL